MKQLLEMAKKVSDQVEVYSTEYTNNEVKFSNAKLHEIESKIQTVVSLRIIKDNSLGVTQTRNLLNREELIQNALDSLKGGVEANYNFPFTNELPHLYTYDLSADSLSNTQLVNECSRICEHLQSQTDGEIMAGAAMDIKKIRIINSAGTDIADQFTTYFSYGGITYPGSASAVYRIHEKKYFEQMPADMIKELINIYNKSSKVVEPKGGKMKVLFMPNSLTALIWRILSGTSLVNVYKKMSPIARLTGKKIFDEKLTIVDNPHDDRFPGARAFDDEGVATKPMKIIEKGVLKNFYSDLCYASKLNTDSTGNSYEGSPALAHLQIKPGKKSLAQMIKLIDRGIIIEGAMGAHSGNIPNGDFSVGASPGLYVEKGEIVGRVKDVMIAGNAYKTLKRIVDIGKTQSLAAVAMWPHCMGKVPPILCDSVSVTTKN
ncbi:MAG: TldD/PmbA family protein [candidate division Zixibacteria bacterium]|nr:TldD/PmbA family protein [candidate division Zixibacteria bacterium]